MNGVDVSLGGKMIEVVIRAITDEIERQANENGDYFVRETFNYTDDSTPIPNPNVIAFDGRLDIAKIAAAVTAVK